MNWHKLHEGVNLAFAGSAVEGVGISVVYEYPTLPVIDRSLSRKLLRTATVTVMYDLEKGEGSTS